MASDLEDAAVHGEIVVVGGDDEICPGDEALLVHAVVMNQSAARGFGNAYALEIVEGGG